MDNSKKTTLDKFKKFEDMVSACNRCGFCTSYCPTYLATGSESQSPRGRNQTFRALLEGKLKNPNDASHIVDTCLLCGECTSVCFAEVPTAHLMVQARDLINHSRGVPAPLSFFLAKILPSPKLFKWFLKVGFLGKKLGISFLLRRIGILQKISPVLSEMDKGVDSAPLQFLLEYGVTKNFQVSFFEKKEHSQLLEQHKLEAIKKSGKDVAINPAKGMKAAVVRPKIAYMPVCGSQYIRPEIGLSTIFLFKKLQLDFMIPDQICCGLPAASYGVTDQVRSMAIENITRLEKGSFESVVIDDSSCASHIKEFPKYFQDDAVWGSRAQLLSQKVRELSSFLIQRGLPDLLAKKTWMAGPIAYHDPCKAQYGQKIVSPPRELLATIPRLTVVPIVDSDQCCGGGGTYSFVHPEISSAVLSAKLKNIKETKCSIVVTSSTSCLIQLEAGIKKAGLKIEVLHLAEFLIRAIDKSR